MRSARGPTHSACAPCAPQAAPEHEAADSIPHISECDFCLECTPDDSSSSQPSERRLLQQSQLFHEPQLVAPPHDSDFNDPQQSGILSSPSSSIYHDQQQPAAEARSKRSLLKISPRPPPKPPKPPKPPNPPKPPKSPDPLDDPNMPLAMRASAYRISHHDKVGMREEAEGLMMHTCAHTHTHTSVLSFVCDRCPSPACPTARSAGAVTRSCLT